MVRPQEQSRLGGRGCDQGALGENCAFVGRSGGSDDHSLVLDLSANERVTSALSSIRACCDEGNLGGRGQAVVNVAILKRTPVPSSKATTVGSSSELSGGRTNSWVSSTPSLSKDDLGVGSGEGGVVCHRGRWGGSGSVRLRRRGP